MQTISGISSVTIDGASYPVGDDLVKFELATINREPVMSKNGTVFTKKNPQAAKMSLSILIPGTIDPSTFQNLDSTNVVVQLANGMTVTANGFATSGNNEYDSNEGKLNLEFYGQKFNVDLGA